MVAPFKIMFHLIVSLLEELPLKGFSNVVKDCDRFLKSSISHLVTFFLWHMRICSMHPETYGSQHPSNCLLLRHSDFWFQYRLDYATQENPKNQSEKSSTQRGGGEAKESLHPPTPRFGSQVKKRVPPKRGIGPHRCVYTNPPTPTKSYSGPRASKEDKRNTPTHLRGPKS